MGTTGIGWGLRAGDWKMAESGESSGDSESVHSTLLDSLLIVMGRLLGCSDMCGLRFCSGAKPSRLGALRLRFGSFLEKSAAAAASWLDCVKNFAVVNDDLGNDTDLIKVPDLARDSVLAKDSTFADCQRAAALGLCGVCCVELESLESDCLDGAMDLADTGLLDESLDDLDALRERRLEDCLDWTDAGWLDNVLGEEISPSQGNHFFAFMSQD
jgi:hypothetical protein